ncbi:hypothetical protein ACF07O_05000 [Streptomyces althioticus]|uniref:hypothetical protein n=1 Tax=Streptomyces althioticus TaxID=83380 RepID=UPI0036FFE6B3
MIDVEVVELLVSPAHRLAGRPSEGPAPGPDDERVTRAEVRARLGLVGDRYFAQAAHRDASVTMMSVENPPPRTSIPPSTCGRPGATCCCGASTSTRWWARP